MGLLKHRILKKKTYNFKNVRWLNNYYNKYTLCTNQLPIRNYFFKMHNQVFYKSRMVPTHQIALLKKSQPIAINLKKPLLVAKYSSTTSIIPLYPYAQHVRVCSQNYKKLNYNLYNTSTVRFVSFFKFKLSMLLPVINLKFNLKNMLSFILFSKEEHTLLHLYQTRYAESEYSNFLYLRGIAYEDSLNQITDRFKLQTSLKSIINLNFLKQNKFVNKIINLHTLVDIGDSQNWWSKLSKFMQHFMVYRWLNPYSRFSLYAHKIEHQYYYYNKTPQTLLIDFISPSTILDYVIAYKQLVTALNDVRLQIPSNKELDYYVYRFGPKYKVKKTQKSLIKRSSVFL